MKKLVFVLLAIFMLTACEKNDDSLELTNEGISNAEMDQNAFRAGRGTFDRVTIDYKQHVFNQFRDDYRNQYGPIVGMVSWYPCPNNNYAEVWILDRSGTVQEIRDRTVPIHNDAPIHDPDNVRQSPMTIGDTCNAL